MPDVTNWRRPLLASILIAVVAIAGCTGARPEYAGLSANDLDALGLSDVRDLTLAPEGEDPAPGVNRDEAIATAVARVGAREPPLAIMRGRAAKVSGGPLLDVWIVIFEGGTPPNEGPIENATAPPVTMTGVVVDATSGQVLWWFMH